MRKFSSYGPVDINSHYYVPRQHLVDYAYMQLLGENPQESGNYITVWGPRQRGKTWVMQQILQGIKYKPQYKAYDVVKINLEHLKLQEDVNVVVKFIAKEIIRTVSKKQLTVNTLDDLYEVFTAKVLTKPLILILDEFDALKPLAISSIAGVFRNIYVHRQDQIDKTTAEKDYLLHGVALIGVRAVLGIENTTGSPFNVQRSLHIPDLTFAEVQSMFQWYQKESGQPIEAAVIEQLFYETQGQPGLTSWLGELLTETYNEDTKNPITITHFNRTLLWATDGLGNANITNIISKAKQHPQIVLELFETDIKKKFRFDDPALNFLYLNGVIEIEESKTALYIKFPCPLIQKRLFNYFASQIFPEIGRIHAPFEDLSDTISPTTLNLKNLLHRYSQYLHKNKTWLLKDAPRRKDLRLYEAVYHFNLYMYLSQFLHHRQAQVWPEFPTGNGQIDLIIHYANQKYAIEIKSFVNHYEYNKALTQAAHYAKKLNLTTITLALFIDTVDDTNRTKYEIIYTDEETGVKVEPVFVTTG